MPARAVGMPVPSIWHSRGWSWSTWPGLDALPPEWSALPAQADGCCCQTWTGSWTCEPAHPAWTSLLDALVKAWRTLSLDPLTGRRIPAVLRDAGLADTAIQARARTWRPGDPGQLPLLRFIGIFRGKIVQGGILDARQLARLAAEVEEPRQEPGTFVMHPVLFQAWGRRPAGPSAVQLDGPPVQAARS